MKKTMEKSRQAIAFCLVLTALTVFTGCNKSKAGDSGNQAKQTVWRLGTASPEDAVTQLMAVKFAEEVGKQSEGRLKIDVYPNSTLGGDVELLESLAAGSISFVVQTTAPEVDFIPNVAVFDLPCAFSSLEELRRAVNNPAFRTSLEKIYVNGGYHLLGIADQGFRQTTSNKRINTIDDFKGLKIRTMENKYHMAFWRTLGANPTPMNFGEVYIGLQQGTIDAQENPYEPIVSGNLYQQQKYLINTNHVPHMLMLITSEKFYQGLPAADRAILDAAAKIAEPYAYAQTDARSADRIKIITDSGAEIINLSPELYNNIVKASQPVYDQIRAAVGNDLVDSLLNNK
jgi:tripartite ATP-independent transporter DctP family solute receptor